MKNSFICEHPTNDTSIQFSKHVVLSTTASIFILFVLIPVSFYVYALCLQYLALSSHFLAP